MEFYNKNELKISFKKNFSFEISFKKKSKNLIQIIELKNAIRKKNYFKIVLQLMSKSFCLDKSSTISKCPFSAARCNAI